MDSELLYKGQVLFSQVYNYGIEVYETLMQIPEKDIYQSAIAVVLLAVLALWFKVEKIVNLRGIKDLFHEKKNIKKAQKARAKKDKETTKS